MIRVERRLEQPRWLNVVVPIASLAVVAVILTTAAVAYFGWRAAGLPLGAAIALGAIVAPPDAVAASEVLRRLRIPQRVGLVLQGESLLNDATALFIYRGAVAATVSSFSFLQDTPVLLLAAVGSLLAGYLLARLYLLATAQLRHGGGEVGPGRRYSRSVEGRGGGVCRSGQL